MWNKFVAQRSGRLVGALTMGLTLIVLGTPTARAALPNSELSHWLKQDAAPKLLQLVGKHPRFKGERISVVSMHNRKPSTRGHELGRTLEEYLTHRLLSQSQASIAWRDTGKGCQPTRPAPYLLGIEVQPQGRQRAAVTIAMVDVEENIWVPGASLRWQGRLTSSERRALQQTLQVTADGSIERPLSAARQSQILALLKSQLRCAVPTGIDGSLFLLSDSESPHKETLAALTEQLQAHLQRSPLFDMSRDKEDARWQAELITTQAANSTRLDLQLTERDAGRTQRLATLYLDAPSNAPRLATNAPAEPLLSDLEEIEIVPCKADRDKQCLLVEMALQRPAWLITFRSRNGTVSGQSCSGSVKRTKAATRRYRVTLEPSDDIGFYALATTNQSVARKLARTLRAAPGSCNRNTNPDGRWLRQLTKLLELHGDDIAWRATHLAGDSELALAHR